MTAFSPASIGNVAVGFDILGQSLAGPGDRVTVTRTDSGVVRIAAIRGFEAPGRSVRAESRTSSTPSDDAPLDSARGERGGPLPGKQGLPLVAEENTAGRALLALLKSQPPGLGFDVEIDKGIPLGSGMGGSAASAVAAVVAANAVLDQPVSFETLYWCAMQGEAAATGAAHGDNVAPMLMGGLVIAPAEGLPVKIPTPSWLYAAVVHPHFVLETRTARAVLKDPYPLHDFVVQSEGLALLLAGCFTSDKSLIRRGFRDVLVEPRRASLIPGFAKVKRAAYDCGALGASISGAGPSVFGWFDSKDQAHLAAAAMAAAFKDAGLESNQLVSPANGPAAEVVP